MRVCCCLFQILAWDRVPLSQVPMDHIPQLVEQSDRDAVEVTFRTGGDSVGQAK